MVHYKLLYFNSRGRGEPIRTLFALAGVEFEDVRIAKDEWPAMKDKMVFGHLPVLEVDGHQIAQSLTIMRYLGKQFNLAGATPLEEATIDMFVDQFSDFIAESRPYITVAYGNTQGDKPFPYTVLISCCEHAHDVEKLFAEVFVPARAKHFPPLIKFLKGKEFITKSVSWGDVFIASLLANGVIKNVFEGYPELEEYVNRVLAIPRIKEYMANRPAV